jgi:polar amino acid transport system substrate-binding protein
VKLLSIAFGLAAFAAGASALSATTPKLPSFTAAQVAHGRTIYYGKCAMCHGAALEGISGPALKGPDSNLQEQTVSAVYGYLTTEMPVGNAGGLPSKDYVDIMAFLLYSNGRHAASKPLTVAALKAAKEDIGGPK